MSTQSKMLECINCGGELGLRERYERLLDLLGAALVVYHTNNELERDQTNPAKAQNVMESSVQMYEMIGKYWEDIPGDNVREKLTSLEEKRILARDENGEVLPYTKAEMELKALETEKEIKAQSITLDTKL